MSATEYGPDETWPSHQKPFWSEALAEARQAGWTLTFINAPHNFGVVRCPEGEHTFDVDKTARGGETKSREAIKKIRWCPHGTGHSGSKVRARQEECIRLLDVADELIATAEQGLAIAEAKASAQEDLARLELQLQTATSNVSQAEQEAALQAAIELDDAPEPGVLSATLDEAAATVGYSESTAKALSPARPALAVSLLERVAGTHTRINELRTRLAALRERISA